MLYHLREVRRLVVQQDLADEDERGRSRNERTHEFVEVLGIEGRPGWLGHLRAVLRYLARETVNHAQLRLLRQGGAENVELVHVRVRLGEFNLVGVR